MWQAGTTAVLAASLWLLWRQLRPMRGDLLTLVAFGLIWSRFALAALGPSAVQTQLAGQSLIALGTLITVSFVAVVIPLGLYRADQAAPIYGIASLGAAGTILSGSVGALPSYVTLWVLFASLALLLDRAYTLHGPAMVLRALLAAFALPLGMQVVSFGAGLPKVGPDGSLSYIGGYAHEAVFAIVALGALWTATISSWPNRRLAWLAVAVCLAALVLANYRTMLIAALPLVAAFAIFDGVGQGGRILPRVLVICAVGLILLPAAIPPVLIERFADLGTLASDWRQLLKPPETFTAAEKDVLSARVYIWARYAAAVGQADLPQLLLGHGAEALAPGMGTHPHNEYLRVAYQHGLLGVVGLFGLLIALTVAAARAKPRRAGVLTASGFAAFLIAATGTSLFDRPEGMIVLAILTATAWNLSVGRQPVSAAA